MKNRLVRIALVLALVMVALVPASLAHADAGSFSGNIDYSYESGSSGGSSNDYDSSSSDWLLGLLLFNSDTGDSGDIGIGEIALTFALIAAVIVGSMVHQKHKREKTKQERATSMKDEFDSSKLKPIPSLTDAEAPGFNADQMEEHIASLYTRLQDAWTAKDLEPVRPLLSEKLYAQLDRQLDALRHSHRTNKVEDVTVMDVQLSGWYEEAGNVSVVAIVQARIKDYTVDDKTGDIVSGSPKAEKFMKYRYTLTQPKGAGPADQSVTNCPNCGAPVDINKSAECPYCGTMIKSASYTWVVSAIQGLEQRTA